MSIKRIDITEADNTTPSAVEGVTDIIYIPGLANTSANISAKVDDVVVINSDEDFVKYLGQNPVEFNSSTTGNYADAGIAYDKDMSFIYARNLVNQGATIAYDVIGNESTNVAQIYNSLLNQSSNPFTKLSDVGSYNVKYITSGAYPAVFNPDPNNSSTYNSNIAKNMIESASSRGDAVAVIDHAHNLTDKFYEEAINTSAGFGNGSFGTMFTPWGNYSITKNGYNAILPASYGYLSSLTKSVKTNANFLAVAGVARGKVPGLVDNDAEYTVTNSVADSYQDKSKDVTAINGITDINPYGLCIWGNRTLLQNGVNGPIATSYLNIRNMISDIKKDLRKVALSLLFEQNSDVLWLKFKSRISPTLDKMVAGNGILAYNLIKNKTKDKTKFSVDVVIQPVYPVEEVQIKVVVTDDDVTVA